MFNSIKEHICFVLFIKPTGLSNSRDSFSYIFFLNSLLIILYLKLVLQIDSLENIGIVLLVAASYLIVLN